MIAHEIEGERKTRPNRQCSRNGFRRRMKLCVNVDEEINRARASQQQCARDPTPNHIGWPEKRNEGHAVEHDRGQNQQQRLRLPAQPRQRLRRMRAFGQNHHDEALQRYKGQRKRKRHDRPTQRLIRNRIGAEKNVAAAISQQIAVVAMANI